MYSVGGIPQPDVNAGVDRFTSHPNAVNYLRHWYTPTGKTRIPVVTLHNTLDPDVPFSHQEAYAGMATAAGSSDLLVQVPVARYVPCDFTAQEAIGALQRLLALTAQ